MRSLFSTLPRAALLCTGFFLMAAEDDGCVIRIIDDTDDECLDRDEVCPNLVCDNGFVQDDEGCEICECEPASCELDGAIAPPECPAGTHAIFDEAQCAFVCLPDERECFSDEDCPEGFFCAVFEQAPPDGDDDAARRAGGVCVERGRDCGDGSDILCDMIAPQCPRGTASFPQNGCFSPCLDVETCEPAPTCADFDCAFCVETDDGPRCLPPGGECETDRDCGEGAQCVQECLPDPSCPMCDVCLLVGLCVEQNQGCFSDLDCDEGEVCTVAWGREEPNLPCLPDEEGGCGFAQGICVPAQPEACRADDECRPGQICAIETICGGCEETRCEVGSDGEERCFPCDPICFEEGRCIDVPPTGDCREEGCPDGGECVVEVVCTGLCDACEPNSDRPCLCDEVCEEVAFCAPPADERCVSDDECGRGEHCNAADLCLPPPDCDPRADACTRVCTGFCVADEPPPSERCMSDNECGNGLVCNAADICLPPPGCEDDAQGCPAVCTGFCVEPGAEGGR